MVEVDVLGIRARYTASGTGDPVVLIHGLSGSTRWWRPTVGALMRRHRVYVLDLPGWGSLARRGRFVLAEAAPWVAAWMDTVGLQSAHLVGHSMGGTIAISLAAEQPARVRRLVLVAPAALPAERSRLGHIIPLLRGRRHIPPQVLLLVAADALRAGPVFLWRTAGDVLRTDVRAKLHSVSAPTLLIWGDRDGLVPPSNGLVLREEIPHARLLLIAGAGHVPMVERSSQFNETVLRFLAGEEVGT